MSRRRSKSRSPKHCRSSRKRHSCRNFASRRRLPLPRSRRRWSWLPPHHSRRPRRRRRAVLCRPRCGSGLKSSARPRPPGRCPVHRRLAWCRAPQRRAPPAHRLQRRPGRQPHQARRQYVRRRRRVQPPDLLVRPPIPCPALDRRPCLRVDRDRCLRSPCGRKCPECRRVRVSNPCVLACPRGRRHDLWVRARVRPLHAGRPSCAPRRLQCRPSRRP